VRHWLRHLPDFRLAVIRAVAQLWIVMPLPMKQCLSCRSDRVVSGKIAAGRDPAVFQPDGLRSFTFTLLGGTKFTEQAFACLDCGLVWSSTSAGELRMFIEKNCG